MNHLNMSLDQVALENKKTRTGGNGSFKKFSGRRGARSGKKRGGNFFDQNRPDVDNAWVHDQFNLEGGQKKVSGKQPLTIPLFGFRVTLSNLNFNILEDDLRDLLSQYGQVVGIKLHFDSSARSTGVCDVVFHTKYEAENCIKECNNRELQGQAISLKFVGRTQISKDGRIIEEKNTDQKVKRVSDNREFSRRTSHDNTRNRGRGQRGGKTGKRNRSLSFEDRNTKRKFRIFSYNFVLLNIDYIEIEN